MVPATVSSAGHGEGMKKTVVVVGALLVLAAAGTPVVNGILMERGYRQLVAEVNSIYREQGNDLQVEIVRYDRGLYSSEVEWQIDLGSMKTVYGVDRLVVLDRGRHGYTSVTFATSLAGNPWYQEFVASRLGGNDPLTVATEYSLLGTISAAIHLAPFTVTADGQTVDAKAADLKLTSDWELSRIQANGTWQGLTVQDQLKVEGVSFNSDLRLISSFIWDGGASLHVGKLSGRDGAKELAVDGLRTGYTLAYDQQRKSLDIETSYGVGRITDGLETVENGSATIGVRGLDAQAYEEAMKAYTKLLGQLLADIDAAGADPQTIRKQLENRLASAGLQLLGLVEKVLKAGLEIYVGEVQAGLAQGEVRGQAVLKLERDLSFVQMLSLSQQPEQFFDFLSLQADLQLPAELVAGTSPLLAPLHPGMKTGLLVREGNLLVGRAETRDKKLFINSEQVVFN